MAGSINSTTQSLDQYLQQRLSNLESEFLQFKNTQPIGADVLNITNYPTPVIIGPMTIAAGASNGPAIQVVPASLGYLTLFNFTVSVTVDHLENKPSAPNYSFPYGNLLTSGQKALTLMQWDDYFNSDDTTNLRTYIVWIQNNDTVSHTYYVYLNAYFPKGALS